MQDISLGGATFDCVIDRPVGSQLMIEIEGLSQQLTVRIARVGKHLHVQFPLNEQTATIISEFMNRHERLGACAAAPQRAAL